MKNHVTDFQISLFLDGQLGVLEMREIARHMGDCRDCRALLEGWTLTRSTVRAVGAPAGPSPEFWTNAYHTLRVQDQETQRTVSQAPLWALLATKPRRWATGAIGLIALGSLISAPLLTASQHGHTQPVATASSDVVNAKDVSSLVRAHTQSVSIQPLGDRDQQTMLAADFADTPNTDQLPPEAAPNADGTD